MANLSKFTCGFSDYPMPESESRPSCSSSRLRGGGITESPCLLSLLSSEYPIFLRADQFQEYTEDYARHFDLLKDWKLNTAVRKATRNKADTKWCLEIQPTGEEPKTVEFDKVVFCHGYQTKARMPKFEGQDKFEGIIMHSQQYRRSECHVFPPF